MEDLPHDSDGDALRRLSAKGSDLAKPMEIEFSVDVPNKPVGDAFAKIAVTLGFITDVYQDKDDKSWTCYCKKVMVPSYAEIISIQDRLDELGKPLGAKSDGWGSFGNSGRS